MKRVFTHCPSLENKYNPKCVGTAAGFFFFFIV